MINHKSKNFGRVSVAALAFAMTVATVLASRADPKPDITNLETSKITVTAAPITSFSRLGGAGGLGSLEFRGGLVLQSEHPNFGGWSGIVLDDAARKFVAVSDTGIWMTGAVAYKDGKPAGLEETRIGPLLGQDGTVLARNRYRDAEAVALEKGMLEDGTLLVSFERKARVARYKIGADGPDRADGALGLPKKIRAMRRNQGFEALTVMRGGALKGQPVVFAERLYNKSRDHTGWMWTAKGVETIYVKNIADFDVTDIASDEGGALYVLERRFRWTEGVKMRLRRIAADDLKAGATVTGETLIEADMSSQIDNMEALAVTRTGDGDILITMMSDDNMNRTLQRTLLLQFVLRDGGDKKARLQP